MGAGVKVAAVGGKAVVAGVKASVDVLVKEWETSAQLTLQEMRRIWGNKKEEYQYMVAKLRGMYHEAIKVLNDKVDEMELDVLVSKEKFYELKAKFDNRVRKLLPKIFDEIENFFAVRL